MYVYLNFSLPVPVDLLTKTGLTHRINDIYFIKFQFAIERFLCHVVWWTRDRIRTSQLQGLYLMSGLFKDVSMLEYIAMNKKVINEY
jgi:hypothetical protein